MIKEQNKNKLLIKFNNFVAVNKLYKALDNLIQEGQIEKLTHLLANDLKGILALFGKETANHEKYIVGLIYYSKLIDREGSGFDLDLITKWNHFNDEQKNNFLELITCKKSLTHFGSFEYLKELQSQELINISVLNTIFDIIESFIKEFLNEIFLFEDDEVKSKVLEKFKSIISLSIDASNRIDIEEYKNIQLEKLQYSISDNKLLLEHPDEIKDLIYKSEKDIITSNPEYILKFLKASDFIKRQYEVIEKSIFVLKKEDNKEVIDEWVEAIISQIGIYNISYLNCVAMISSLVFNRLTHFYELFYEFEGLGVFNTSYEKNVLDSLKVIENEMITLNENLSIGYLMIENKLNQVIEGISSLNQAIYENTKAIYHLESRIVSSFQSLEKSIASTSSELAKSINGHLVNIDSKIGFNNLVSVVSAYQLYKINKQTKPLLLK
jgi:hypothetical protein